MLSRTLCGLILACLASLHAAVPPAGWVPARWNWTDPKTLDLLSGTPINCLLLERYTPEFVREAIGRGILTLAVLTPGPDLVDAARAAIRAKLAGVVLEGDFPNGTAQHVKDALADSQAIVIELASRNRIPLGGTDPVIGTYQGVWPGIQVTNDGAAQAGPTGSAWIDTNEGFIRSVRAWGHQTIWLGNRPPEKTVITGERYLQAVCDAAVVGARWIIALDDDFAARLAHGDQAALQKWQRIGKHLRFYEDHPEWRSLAPYGQLAVVQDHASGAMLSGGILDMIATKHTPVRPIPRQKLTPGSLQGASLALNVDPELITPEQRQVLQSFTRSGGTLVNGPRGWKANLKDGQITLEKADLDRLNDIWRDAQSMIGRRNLGARLFNVSSMLSNLETTSDGKQVFVKLVNYSDYPVESVTVHLLGSFRRARLYTPEGGERELEIYPTEEGTGVDIDQISVCATLRLD